MQCKLDYDAEQALKDQFQPDKNMFDSSAILFDEAVPVYDIQQVQISDTCIASTAENTEPVHADGDDVVLAHDKPTASCRKFKPATKRTHYIDKMSDSIVSRKKAKTVIDEELAEKRASILDLEMVTKKRELEMKEIEHKKRCDILDIEAKIKLKELEMKDYETKNKELEYKAKLRAYLDQ